MKVKTLSKTTLARWIFFCLCQAFCLSTAIYFGVTKNSGKAFMGGISLLYVCIPLLVEKLFKFRLQISLYFVTVFYAVCPLLGYAYNMYYTVSWWDDIMHAFSGVIFAMFGAYLPKVINKNGKNSLVLCALFGLVFSMAISMAWEFVEFSLDSFFGTDMQKDTLIYNIRSYLLGEWTDLPVSEMAEWNVNQVVVNGTELPGYLDIGLIDSMKDMIVETVGAIVYVVIYIAGKGKHFVFETLEEERERLDLTAKQAQEEQTEPQAEAAIASDEKTE